jgi:hypothetical protein
MSYLERYQAGEYEQVWNEMAPRYWKEAQAEPFYSEALAVARAMMARVRENIVTLIPRLESINYSFGYVWIDEIRPYFADIEAWAQEQPPTLSPPLSDVQDRFRRLEEDGIRLPISLRAWYEIVGAVNFVGTPPARWAPSGSSLDPLRVDPLEDYMIEECIRYKQLCIAPDEFHKYYTSGSGGYCIELDAPSTDGLIEGGWLRTSFVEYLRIAISWGGFPGIGRWHKRPEKDIAYLTEGLLPL